MSLMVIHCPGCNVVLHVPESAGGRRARCPSCKAKFLIPSPREMLDETVAAWLVSEVNKDEPDAAAGSMATQIRRGPVAGDTTLPDDDDGALERLLEEQVLDEETLTAEVQPVPDGTAIPTDKTPAPAPAKPAPVAAPPGVSRPMVKIGAFKQSAQEAKLTSPPATAQPSAAGASPIPMPILVASPIPASTTPLAGESPAHFVTSHHLADGSPTVFPGELVPVGPHPHLVVMDVSQNGVRVAFDSAWLESVHFRMSMPLRGIFSGKTERGELHARPLIWADRSGAAIRSASETEVKYEQPLLPNWTIKDVITNMGLIEGLPRPFCNPMPYYVDNAHRQLSVSCATFKRSDGGITCEVTVPAGAYALDWLRNVNGTCGPEFEMLERELGMIQSDQWSQLSETVRQRVGVWCKFHPRERFELYLSDADFGTRDAGLAGLIVTDRRLVFHKFHHTGQVDLAQAGTLHVKRQDDFAHLSFESWQTPGARSKMVKLHLTDLDKLYQSLAGKPTLNVLQS